MSTLTIDYNLLGDNSTVIRNVETALRAAGMPDSKIYGTLKNISATFKEAFDKAVQLVSDKPRSQTDVFNEFIGAKEWQTKFSEANEILVRAYAEMEILLRDVEGLPTPAFKPLYTTGADPQRKAWKIEIVVDKHDQKEAFALIDSMADTLEQAKTDLTLVSLAAVKAKWPEGNSETGRDADGKAIMGHKALKVEKDDEGKWTAAGKVSGPVDPNKPKVARIGVGRRTLTITYGEELVYQGGNTNLAYTKSGIFCASRKLGPFAAKPDFGMKNGQMVIVGTKWDEVGKPALEKSGLKVVETVA